MLFPDFSPSDIVPAKYGTWIATSNRSAGWISLRSGVGEGILAKKPFGSTQSGALARSTCEGSPCGASPLVKVLQPAASPRRQWPTPPQAGKSLVDDGNGNPAYRDAYPGDPGRSMAACGNIPPADKTRSVKAAGATAVLDTIVCGRIINGYGFPGQCHLYVWLGWAGPQSTGCDKKSLPSPPRPTE